MYKVFKKNEMKHHPIKCAYCEVEFVPERRNQKYCSTTCKQYNYLTKKTGKDYRMNKNQNPALEKPETPPLTIGEKPQLPDAALHKGNIPVITITYELSGKEPPHNPPDTLELRRWYFTLTG